MNTNVHELAQTVENVLEFVLASAGAKQLPKKRSIWRNSLPRWRKFWWHRNATRISPSASNSTRRREKIVAQRRPLRSIVLNLAINAIKFTRHGEVSICVSGDPRPSEIAVRDTGEGINQELLSSAFEPMVQLSHSSIRRHRGLGLGLPMVQRI